MPSSQVMHKFKTGKLHSGSKTGKKVTNRSQAIAIMLSEKRKEQAHGGKYPHARPGHPLSKKHRKR
jgi:hypothetical protein